MDERPSGSGDDVALPHEELEWQKYPVKAFQNSGADARHDVDASAEVYQLCPVHNPREIRVLSIIPAQNFHAPLDCALTVASLDDNDVAYQTISYAWESQEPTEAIKVNGCTMYITKNLLSALRRIRQMDLSSDNRLLRLSSVWADGICINQKNDLEKGRQVGMMGDIYARSQRLLIWLGEASDTDINALKDAIRGRDTTESRRDVTLALLARSWFRRRWVVQEVFRSPPMKRHCMLGNYRFWLEELKRPLQTVHAHYLTVFEASVEKLAPILVAWLELALIYAPASASPSTHWDGRGGMAQWMHLSSTIQESSDRGRHQFTLFHLLVRLSQMHCREPVDRIYSLLGLCLEKNTFEIDYTVSYGDLSYRVARQESPVCAMLCATAWSAGDRADLPSWVPDWSTYPVYTTQWHRHWVHQSTTAQYGFEYDYKKLKLGSSSLVRAQGAPPIQVEGHLLRDCGHSGWTGNRPCPVCCRITQRWTFLVLGHLIFELRGWPRGGNRSFKLSRFVGDIRDEVTSMANADVPDFWNFYWNHWNEYKVHNAKIPSDTEVYREFISVSGVKILEKLRKASTFREATKVTVSIH